MRTSAEERARQSIWWMSSSAATRATSCRSKQRRHDGIAAALLSVDRLNRVEHGVVLGVEGFQLRILQVRGRRYDCIRKADSVRPPVVALVQSTKPRNLGGDGYGTEDREESLQCVLFRIAPLTPYSRMQFCDDDGRKDDSARFEVNEGYGLLATAQEIDHNRTVPSFAPAQACCFAQRARSRTPSDLPLVRQVRQSDSLAAFSPRPISPRGSNHGHR